MDVNTLIENIATAIATDSAVTAWANTTYSKTHTVLVSFDRRNPPGEDEAPFVVVYPVTKQVGQGRSEKLHAVEVDVCIVDESEAEFDQSNLIGYAGVQRIEAFRKLVETAVIGTDVGNGLFDSVDVEYEIITDFPSHWAGMLFEINEKTRIGIDPFL